MTERGSATRADEVTTLGDVVERLHGAATGERVSVDDVVEAVGKTSLVPLLLVPALLAATPLSGIPGLSAACGLAIAAISVQLLLSYGEVRLPGFLRRRSVRSAELRRALERSRRVIGWIDRLSRPRLRGLFHRPLIFVPELLCLLSGLAMPLLEVIPFSASIVATAVAFLALSMLTRDGLFFLVALGFYALLGWLLATQLPWG